MILLLSPTILSQDSTRNRFIDYVNQNALPGDAVLSYTEDISFFRNDLLIMDYGPSKDIAIQSHNLYSLLRKTDDLGAPRVFIRKPRKTGKQLALYNRLIRASGSDSVVLSNT